MNFKCLLLVFTVWYISDCGAGHFYSGLFNDRNARENMNKNEHSHKRIMKQLHANPHVALYQNSQYNLKIRSNDVLSTLDYAKPRKKRMNHKNDENENNDDQQALFDEVFGSRSIDSSKLSTNNVIGDQTFLNDPGLNENIKLVFGSSERLLAINNANEKINLESTDRDIEDIAKTEKTHLNEMIIKNFGPEMLEDEPETTTDADAVEAAPDSSNDLSSTISLLYLLFPLILIL